MNKANVDVSYELPEGMVVPDFYRILRMCLTELVAKYPYYGNDWIKNTQYELKDGTKMSVSEYFNYRLKKETEELDSALTVKEAQRKLVNIINLASLRLHRMVNG